MTAHFDHAKIVSLRETMTVDEIARVIGCSRPTIYNALRAAGKVSVRRPEKPAARRTASRFVHEPLSGQVARMPPYDHPALMAGGTIYPSTVIDEHEAKHALKSGMNSAKIGGVIRKGKWSGFPIYTLALEERATCPKSCAHWRSCYGNHMHLAERMKHGESLEWRIERELGWLEVQHRAGFAVRLHVLGDFYSVAYVRFWRDMLDKFKSLRVFGFSARWEYQSDPIAKELIDLAETRWARFAIRFSNAPVDQISTISIEHPFQKPANAIICPAQLGKTESCSTCGLCWNSTKRIAFLQH